MNREQMITHLTLLGWEPMWDRDHLYPWYGVGNASNGGTWLNSTERVKSMYYPHCYTDCAPVPWEKISTEGIGEILREIMEADNHAS